MGLSKGQTKKLSKSDLSRIREIGNKLKKIRREKGYSSYENFAFDTHIPRMAVYRMEKGAADFNFSTLLKILDALNVKPKEFFKDLD
jgi:transcriptional regulator with XRE-family HTH domain